MPSSCGLEGVKERMPRGWKQAGQRFWPIAKEGTRGKGEVTFLELEPGKAGCLSRKDLQTTGLREGLLGGGIHMLYL